MLILLFKYKISTQTHGSPDGKKYRHQSRDTNDIDSSLLSVCQDGYVTCTYLGTGYVSDMHLRYCSKNKLGFGTK